MCAAGGGSGRAQGVCAWGLFWGPGLLGPGSVACVGAGPSPAACSVPPMPGLPAARLRWAAGAKFLAGKRVWPQPRGPLVVGERRLPARAECVDPSGQDQGWDCGTVPGRSRSHGRLLTLVLAYPWLQVPVRATGGCSAGEGPETPGAALRQAQDKHEEGRGCRAQALRGGRHGGLSGGR